MSKPAPSFYEFGPFRLDTVKRLLLRGGAVVQVPPKAFDTLFALIENSDRVVEKSELMAAIWPDSFVEEANLTQNISILRKALGERPGEHSYIVTVPGRGYRFVASVSGSCDEEASVLQRRARSNAAIEEVKSDADLILGKRTVTRIVAEREEVPFSQGENEGGLRSLEKVLPQGIWANPTPGLNRTLLILCALAVVGLVTASYFFISRNSLQPDSILEVKSIAVLPFKTLGEDVGDEYLGSELADALITRLSSIRRITVRPTSSVMKYTGSKTDPIEAGRQLGVEAVLDGRIQKSDERVRVTVQLLRVSDGKPIWAAKFEEKFATAFALQDSISDRMAKVLESSLSREELERFAMRYTENAEAFQAYMKGRYWWNKRTGRAFSKAIDFFNQAIALDSNYALAYAGLADCYAMLSPYSLVPRDECYPKARESARKALEIDEHLAEAHSSLAHITWLYDWNWAEAEKEFKRAIELNPKCSTAHSSYSVYLSSMARHEEAIAEAQLAQGLDPLSIPIYEDLARAFYHARQYDQAILAALKTLELDPNYYRINGWLNFAYEQKGFYDQAIETQLKAMSLVGVKPEELEASRATYKATGWKGYWQRDLELTKQRAKEIYVLPYNLARICARIGDDDQAFAWLERAYKEHSDHLVLLKVDPILNPLRSDPRFVALLRRVGFEG